MGRTLERVGVIFDCDGTLVDSMGVWRELEEELARRAGVVLSPEDTDTLTTLTISECGAYFHGNFGLGGSAQDVVDMIDAFMLEYYRDRSCPRQGALAFVQALAECGVRMSVASSTPPVCLNAGVAHCGFAPYLDAVVSVDDVGMSKREPAVYNRARELMGTPRERTWVFEDAAYALRTVRAAGYPAVGIYDCDLSGTWEELLKLADIAIRSFGDIASEDLAI